ncbi:ABC transporter ATP-binding protein [Clostridium omnivorum]|uniref:ABC transporter ATP-binding protein n=1 Tax=Clostridium omnivorum TaxID=1604902 RepID=A0ABQ5N640_9CLOT|nr:ABC transporter ATP-binding protein [Clostridium sp. E14]GLC30698.1 ABC transporter ATP-binding protein [Clostridium sp. E14]
MKLEIQNLRKNYNTEILKGISVVLESNKIYSLLGKNGAGKTTFMKILSGQIKYNEGMIKFHGDLNHDDISYTPESGVFLEYLTGHEHLELIKEMKKLDFNDSYLSKYAKKFNIYDFWDELVINYSHGMRHQLSLAMALLTSPKVLLLDEPLTSLDPINVKFTKDILLDYADEGNIVIISTHILPIASQLSNDILVLVDGKFVELKNKYNNKDRDCEFEEKIISLLK